ncbi:MAG: L,D-transpeptidase [Planctomycetota bacterium]|nr:MAG: L,D-transpeptidase [Planctomycetota bacterium]
MARRRYMRGRWRRPVGLLVLAAGIATVWYWQKDGPSPSESEESATTITLKSELNQDNARKVTRDVETPAANSALASNKLPKKSQATDKKALVKLTTPSASQPARNNKVKPNSARADAELKAADAAKKRNDLIGTRTHLNRALQAGLAEKEAQRVRKELSELANKTIFSLSVDKNDPLVTYYVVQKYDALAIIAKRFEVPDDLLAQINNIKNKNIIREKQRLKVIKGPFHALIDKSEHLMHIFLQDTYVRTYRVALGTHNSTPTGKWRVGTRQENPSWTDPRPGGKRWYANDPQNPIGEYWISLKGIEGDAVEQFGYGIHGTIEPETIGQDVSLGCVRLAPDDIAMVYKMLMSGHSLVTIIE